MKNVTLKKKRFSSFFIGIRAFFVDSLVWLVGIHRENDTWNEKRKMKLIDKYRESTIVRFIPTKHMEIYCVEIHDSFRKVYSTCTFFPSLTPEKENKKNIQFFTPTAKTFRCGKSYKSLPVFRQIKKIHHQQQFQHDVFKTREKKFQFLRSSKVYLSHSSSSSLLFFLGESFFKARRKVDFNYSLICEKN